MKSVVFPLSMLLVLSIIQGCSRESKSEEPRQIKSNDGIKGSKENDNLVSNGYSEVNEINMYYEIYGAGKPLVLIHGGGSTIETSFGRIIPALSKHHKVIAVELQAHGHTTDRNSDLSFEQDSDDVAALLRNLKIDHADFLGFSNGGNTALQMAIRHPDLTNKIVAASALLKRSGAFPQFWEFMKRAKIEQMPKEYKDAFLKITTDTSRLINMHDKCVKRMVEFKGMSDAQIKSISAPVLLINGDADVATSEHMVQMSRLIPNCKLAIIPGGHGEYMGEITTLKSGQKSKLEILPILEKFLE